MDNLESDSNKSIAIWDVKLGAVLSDLDQGEKSRGDVIKINNSRSTASEGHGGENGEDVRQDDV
jgi:hypothetical protein